MKHKLLSSSIALLFLLVLSGSVYAQVNFSQSFDVNPFPPAGWSLAPAGPPNIWSRQMNGNNPACTPHSGAGMARFFSDMAAAGNTQSLVTPAIDYSGLGTDTARISLWIFRDLGAPTAVDSLTILVNTSANLAGAVRIGAIARYRLFDLPDTVSANGWYQYTFDIPQTFNTDTNYVLLKGTSAQGNNIFIDDVNWDAFPTPCSGTPTAGTINANPNIICGGSGSSALTLSGESTGYGLQYEWQSASSAAGPWTSFVIGPLTSISTGTISSSMYYRVITTCTFASLSDTTAAILVTVSNNPLPVITASPATVSYCAGSAAVLLNASGGVAYTWAPATGLDTTIGDSVYASPNNNTSYIVTGFDSLGCASTDTVAVTVHQIPNVNANANPDTLCEGDSTTLIAFGGGPGTTYVWNPGSFTGQNFMVSPSTTTLYIVTATSTFGCVNSDSITIGVYPSPVANFGYTVNGRTVTFSDSSSNAISWHWDFGDGNSSSLQNPLYTYSYDSTFTVTLIVSNGICPGGDTIVIMIPIVTSGIEEANGNGSVQIFPNPAINQFTIYDLRFTILNAEVYDAIGNKIVSQQPIAKSQGQIAIDVSSLPSGIYYVKVRDEKNNLLTRKFVKL
jgi:PKD repeat protein